MRPRVAFHTLGCKLNQLETESFADAFARCGWTVLPSDSDGADLVLINTCTVTSKAEQKARRIIRLALASDPGTAALVTGCYAQVEAEAIEAIDPRVAALPGAVKDAVLGLPDWLRSRGFQDQGGSDLVQILREWIAGLGSATAGEGRFAYDPETFAFHSRPLLKVQDGCDNECSYCRVRIARGRASSLPAAEALSRARALEAAGRAEIVLTGVNLSQYRDGETDFPALLRLLVAGTSRICFRLSSYEPDRLDAAFLEVFSEPRLRPHVHLAVQSGADPVLERMGRRYGRKTVIEAVEALRRARQDPFIGADLIVGFPGETEEDAQAGLELARQCDFGWIHAFRFSPRPGTAAASMPGRVPERVAGERAEALLGLARRGKAAYVGRWAGRSVEAVLEESGDATTANYLKVGIRGLPQGARRGQALECRIEEPFFRDVADTYDAYALYISDSPGHMP
jgi:threonylcarbamoyladenosine tRNA methylthiotransferase MtaB